MLVTKGSSFRRLKNDAYSSIWKEKTKPSRLVRCWREATKGIKAWLVLDNWIIFIFAPLLNPHTPHLPLSQRTLLTPQALLRDRAGLQGSIQTKKNTPSSTSPWGGSTWCTAEKMMSDTPHTSYITRQSQHEWRLIPAFSGPPHDALIEELDGYYPVQPTGLTQLHKCSLSPFGRSLPKFELNKFDGSALVWPNWIGRFKTIVWLQED